MYRLIAILFKEIPNDIRANRQRESRYDMPEKWTLL